MAAYFIEPDGGFVAERDRLCMLTVGAPGHGRCGVGNGMLGQNAGQGGKTLINDGFSITDLQHHPGINDVLRGRAPVHVFT